MKLKQQVQSAALVVTEPAILRRILYTLEIFMTPWEKNYVSDILNKIDLTSFKGTIFNFFNQIQQFIFKFYLYTSILQKSNVCYKKETF